MKAGKFALLYPTGSFVALLFVQILSGRVGETSTGTEPESVGWRGLKTACSEGATTYRSREPLTTIPFAPIQPLVSRPRIVRVPRASAWTPVPPFETPWRPVPVGKKPSRTSRLPWGKRACTLCVPEESSPSESPAVLSTGKSPNTCRTTAKAASECK